MNTLLLRFCAPMQSWGVQSRFTVRDSGLEPSKSGVIGLLCAALGRPRHEPLTDLTALRMGVRVDREGVLLSDYHIAQNVLASDARGSKESIPSTRYYLADAAFLVGLESEDLPLLDTLSAAVRQPVWMLFFGRKAFAPAKPVALPDGLRLGETLETALQSYPRIVGGEQGKPAQTLRVVLDDPGGQQLRNDVPVSFQEREFAPRRVSTRLITAPAEIIKEEEDVPLATDS